MSCYFGHKWKYTRTREGETKTWSFYVCERCGKTRNRSYTMMETKEHPIYICTAPFGILVNKLSGRGGGSGGGSFLGWDSSFSFSMSSDLQENYIVKYMKDNFLETKKFATKWAKVKIDGKFVLEVRTEHYYELRDGEWKRRVSYIRDEIIHLPELPEPDFKTTTNFLNFNPHSSAPSVNNVAMGSGGPCANETSPHNQRRRSNE